MSDFGHYSPPVNRPLTEAKFSNMGDDGLPGRPMLGVCPDCGLPNSAHQGIAYHNDECPEANR